jgi:hypothetical protein
MVFGRGGCVYRGVGEVGGFDVWSPSPGDTEGNAALLLPPLTERSRSDAPGIGTGDVERGPSLFREARRSSALARISAYVPRDIEFGVVALCGSRSPASGASLASLDPTESLRRRVQFMPHLRMASLA